MKKLHRLTLLVAVLIGFSASAAQAGGAAKVKVCHIPPGNPSNWHTITISQNALSAHLGHGDLAGSCEANCETLCSDGNPCTQNVDPQASQCRCLATPQPVSCDDSLLCTADSCDPSAGGCVYAPINCSDGDLCTVDVCDPTNGSCVSTPTDCGDGEFCDSGTGECYDPCSGILCEPLDQCHVAGTCTDGTCDNPVAPDGTACDDGNAATTGDACTTGTCAGTEGSACPCWTEADLALLPLLGVDGRFEFDCQNFPNTSQQFITRVPPGDSESEAALAVDYGLGQFPAYCFYGLPGSAGDVNVAVPTADELEACSESLVAYASSHGYSCF